MKKGIIIWCVILALLVATLIIYAATEPNPVCNHDYSSLGDGKGFRCEYCGKTADECPNHSVIPCGEYSADNKVCEICREPVKIWHSMLRIDCSKRRCTKCGYEVKIETKQHVYGEAHLINAQTCEIAISCKDCGEVYETQKHNMDYQVVNCRAVNQCSFCGKIGEKYGESHKWKSSTCSSGATCERCGVWRATSTISHQWVDDGCVLKAYCKDCGCDNPLAKETHQYNNAFLRMFGVCTKCGQWQFESKRFDWGARVAEVLGVFLIAFAFQYVVRKRKFIHFKWLIVMFMWLEENTHFGNFCPAVLWKKKLN